MADLFSMNNLAIINVILLGTMLIVVFGAAIIVIWFLFVKKDKPILTLYKFDDFQQIMELSKQTCPPECLNKKIGLSGDGRHMKAVLGKIKGLKCIGTLTNDKNEPIDIMFCSYVPNGENELVFALLNKELGNVVFAESECDSLIGDITLNGINIENWGRYNYLVSREVNNAKITLLLDQKTLQANAIEAWQNTSNIAQFAIRCDAQHHKSIEQTATTAQAQQAPPVQPQQK